MYNFVRIFNQNRRQILIAILAIVFVLALIHLVNNMYKKENEEKLKQSQNIIENKTTSSYNPSHSVITGTNISENLNKKNENVISEFIRRCNEGLYEDAYKMLSEDCKNELYQNINYFKIYLKENFSTKKNYTMQLWVSDSQTYKVDLVEDALATGKINNKSFQDFYTIVKENEEYKLNISEYIGKAKINKSATQKDITIEVNYKNVFKDYEIYNITIKNESENSILIDSRESTQKLYLVGSEEAKYTAYLHEIDNSSYKIDRNVARTLNIKFSKQFSIKSRANKLVFADIILDSKQYEETTNKSNYKKRIEISVGI